MLRSPSGWLSRMTLGRKFFLAFALLAVCTGLSLAGIYYSLHKINGYVDRNRRITVPALVTAADMRQGVFQMSLTLAGLAARPAPQALRTAARTLDDHQAEVQKRFDLYRSVHAVRPHPVLYAMLIEHGQSPLIDREDAALREFGAAWEDWRLAWPAAVAALEAGRQEEARGALARTQRIGQRLLDAIGSLMDIHTRIAVEMKSEGDALFAQAAGTIVALVTILGLVIAGIYLTLTRQIVAPLTHVAGVADRVAHQDLSAQFAPWPSRDEVGDLTRSLNVMLTTLRERTDALERKTRELESFTYSVAHDLKAPLREIEGFATLLRQQAGAALAPEAARYLEIIHASSLRMAALIDGLLRYSRLEQQTLVKSPVKLTALLEPIVAECLRHEPAPHPNIAVALPFDEIWGDATGLRQVFINLLGNALKFSRQRAPREIAVGGTFGPNGERVVWVRDTGVGFDQAHAESVFDLFRRLPGAEAQEGTGVGLAIVKLIMDKHGGRAWVESEKGKGSTFYLAFPEDGRP